MIKKKQAPPTLDHDLVFDRLWEQRNHSFGAALGLLLRASLDSLSLPSPPAPFPPSSSASPHLSYTNTPETLGKISCERLIVFVGGKSTLHSAS